MLSLHLLFSCIPQCSKIVSNHKWRLCGALWRVALEFVLGTWALMRLEASCIYITDHYIVIIYIYIYYDCMYIYIHTHYMYTYIHIMLLLYNIYIYYVLREICANMVTLHAKAQLPTKTSKEVARYTPAMVAVVARMEQNSTNMRRCCSASAWETTPINIGWGFRSTT